MSQWFCDGQLDCEDGFDENEELCSQRTCEPHRFRCDSNKCIPKSGICDGAKDCTDGSDESSFACQSTPHCSKTSNFLCDNGKCIDMSLVCNSADDCTDNSDEKDCENYECPFGTCSQLCESKTIVTSNTSDPETIFYCSCVPGYNLESRHVCLAQGKLATMLLANENAIKDINPYALSFLIEIQDGEPTTTFKIGALDVFYDEGLPVEVYSVKTNSKDQEIRFIRTDQRNERTSDDPSILLVKNVTDFRSLSVEWLNQIVYFVHGKSESVHAISIKSRKSVEMNLGLDEPEAIVVDPGIGQMLVADRGSNPKILVANLDGSQVRDLVTTKLIWPSDLTLDYANKRLYWADLKTKTIESILVDGSSRKVIKQFSAKEGKPLKLDVFENVIYFITYKHHRVFKINKFGKGEVTKIVNDAGLINDIAIKQEQKQNVNLQNPCLSNSCSSLPNSVCLLKADSKTVIKSCVCESGYAKRRNQCVLISTVDNDDLSYEKNEDPCTHLNCYTGKCVVNEEGIAGCECVNPIFEGKFCERYICSGYCLNDGVCYPQQRDRTNDGRARPKCICKEGYHGERCEIKSLSCQCRNGGSCVENSEGQGVCVCVDGYLGDNCEFSQCSQYGYCQNGGTCVVFDHSSPSTVGCYCPPSFTGKYCESYKCQDFCQNGGAAILQENGCACECPPNSFGDRCEVLNCAHDRCRNGGKCTRLDGEEICQCVGKFGGRSCEQPIKEDFCQKIHCENGGICAVRENRAQCKCTRFYIGERCENYNFCVDQCLNGGTCERSTNASNVQCHCHPGYTGKRCENQVVENENMIDDTQVINDTIKVVLITVLVALCFVVIIVLVSYCVRKKRQTHPSNIPNQNESASYRYANLKESDERHGILNQVAGGAGVHFANPGYDPADEGLASEAVGEVAHDEKEKLIPASIKLDPMQISENDDEMSKLLHKSTTKY